MFCGCAKKIHIFNNGKHRNHGFKFRNSNLKNKFLRIYGKNGTK